MSMSTILPGIIQYDFMATNDSELQTGVQNLGPGQTLCVFPGTYNVSFDFQEDPNGVAVPSGEPRNPVTITEYDPTTGTIPDAANRQRIQPQIPTPLTCVFLLQDTHDIVIDSLFLDGSSGEVDPTGKPQKRANDIVKLTGRESSWPPYFWLHQYHYYIL